MVDANVAETIILPSQGKVYEEDVNPEIILSSMTTKHEMLRLSSNENSQKLMSDILDDCIQTDVGISAYDMCLADYQFLLLKLREVTFGNDYTMTVICPYCNARTDVDVDLDDLEVKEFTDEVLKYSEIELPISGDTIGLTLQTPRIIDTINKQVKQAQRKTHTRENQNILYSMLNVITTKNGEPFNTISEEQWLRNLPLADTNYIMDAIDKLNSSFGVIMAVDTVCNVCGEDVVVPFLVNGSFFRPSVLK